MHTEGKKILILIGSTGVIGSQVLQLLKSDYNIIEVNRNSGDFQLDMSDSKAVEHMFQQIKKFDVLIATSGYGKWGTIDEHSINDFHDGLNSKLMGQINLAMLGRAYANPGASILLSSGILAQQPTPGGLSLSMINAAIEAFVRSAAIEDSQITYNAISPSFAKETMEKMGIDSTHGTPAIKFAELYKKAINEKQSGKIYTI